MQSPSPCAVPNTGLPALLDIPIVKSGTHQNTAPTGTGPYLFSDADGTAYLVANQSWWRGGGQPVDRILLTEAADWDTMLYRFTTHDVQLITADLTGISPINATGNTSYLDANTTILQYLGCNTTRAPLDNAAFRKALASGFNRTYIVSAFLSGHGTAAQFPVSPVSSLYPSALEERYSRDSFTAALAASGYTSGRTLSLLVNQENSFKVSVAQYLADTFSSAGVPVEVNALPWEEYTAALAAGNFEPLLRRSPADCRLESNQSAGQRRQSELRTLERSSDGSASKRLCQCRRPGLCHAEPLRVSAEPSANPAHLLQIHFGSDAK